MPIAGAGAENQSSSQSAVRPMLPDDLPQVVEAHLESFPGFFLTFLGRDFLALLYDSIRTDAQGVVLVAATGETVDGFVAGVTEQNGFYRRLISKRKWAFALASIKGFLKRPAIAPRLLRALKRPEESNTTSAAACLMSIGVRPAAQGRGVGKLLVEAFCSEMAKRRVSSVCLTTDRDDNDETNRFYRKLRFRLTRTVITPEGRALNEYLINIEQ